MGNIFDAIRLLGFSEVGSKTKIRKDGYEIECTLEAYSKRKGTATVSYEQNGQKYIAELDLQKSVCAAAGASDQGDDYPSAVFTASGKLVYLASPS